MANANELLQKRELNSRELETLLVSRAKGEVDFLLLDVREEIEHNSSKIVGTDMLMPMSRFYEKIDELRENIDRAVVIYCNSGHRSLNAQELLLYLKFKNVANLTYGIIEYYGEKE